MKKVYILLACVLLLPKLVRAQYYIELNKENTFHYGNSYLIDVPQINEGNLLIEDRKSLVPTDIYPQILGSLDTLFISGKTSLWKSNQFDINASKRAKIVYFPKNYYTQDYYSFQKNDTLKDVDSRFSKYIRIYKEKSLVKKDSALIYYVEGYGGQCCPRDPKWDKLSLFDFIKLFEKKYAVKIGKNYSFSEGEEGEFSDYLTLSGLTPEQKVKFIDERQLSLLSDTEKQQKIQPELYAPFWIGLIYWKSKDGVLPQKVIRDTPYPSVDIQPQFPGGIDAFLARFKSIKADDEAIAIFSFVVRRDGSVTDIKIIRSYNENTSKEIEKLIKEGPKWTPGKIQDNVVSTQCTYKIHLSK